MADSNWQNRILAILLVLSLIVPIWVLARRHRAEQTNKTVELVVDYSEMEVLAGSVGKPVAQVLAEFKEAGATSVAVQEETIGDLLDSGDAVLIPTPPRRSAEGERAGPPETTIWTTSPVVADRILGQLDKLNYIMKPAPDTSGQAAQPTEQPAPYGLYLQKLPENTQIPLTIGIAQARNIPLGLSPSAVDATRAADMRVVARLLNYPGANTAAIDLITRDLGNSDIRTVVFGQEQVLGFRGLIEKTASALQNNGIRYGSVEFAKQKGDAKLAELLNVDLIRAHSIPQAEMGALDRPTAIERYVRAVRERNIRMCYVRLFDMASNDAVGVNKDYMRAIASSLASSGFYTGAAAPIQSPAIPLAIQTIIAIGAAIGFMFLFTSLFKSEWYYTLLYTLLFCVFAALVVVGGGVMGRKALALLTAIVFPTAAAVRAGTGTPAGEKRVGYWRSGAFALGRIVCATAITAAGGIIAAALLSEREFMVKVDQFAGVKLAHVAPLLLALLVFAGGITWRAGSWKEQMTKLRANLAKTASEPALVWQTIAALAVIVLLALAVARSGNDPGVGVSVFELKVRAALDRLLPVRPRTKEFLIGHPILLVGIAAAVLGRRRWAAPLIIFGTIGQISVLNTFCHIHTPIAATALRVTSGLIIGSIIGLVLYAVLRPAMLAGPVPKEVEPLPEKKPVRRRKRADSQSE
ncbi:MAG: DUF5693 family protein [Armatimonadota bacterium]|nr:DUF5693 family protein [Armatimonadota bacterium]